MTQISRPQNGRLIDGWPDSGGYTSAQWAHIFSVLLTQDETTQGVAHYLSSLAVTNPPGLTIRVASGAALVRGRLFANEDQDDPANASNVDFTVVPPAAGSRTDRVVLVQNSTDYDYDGTPDYGESALQIPDDTTDYEYGTSFVTASGIPPRTCRLALLLGDEDSGGAARDLTQDVSLIAGDIWMLELAHYTISSGGVISALTDVRDYVPKLPPRTREVFFPAVPETFSAAGTVADLRGVSLLHNATVSATCYGTVPLDFVSNPKLVAVLCKPASATAPDAKAYMQGYYSLASDGDTFAPPSSIPPFLVSETTLNTIYYQDLDFGSIPTPGDSLSVSIARIFDHPSDTSDQNFYMRGVIFRYTADS